MLSRLFIYGLVIQMMFLNLVLASEVNAQFKSIDDISITLTEHVSTLGDFLGEVESRTPFRFAYDRSDVDKRQQITFRRKNDTIEGFLQQIAQQVPLSFRQVNHDIDIKKVSMPRPVQVVEEEIKVDGEIVNEEGEPIPGATVLVKGGSVGTAADIDGKFSLEVPEGSTLKISFVGFVSQEIEVGNQRFLKIVLKEDLKQLDEIVVVGYGTQKKVDLTGSVAAVDGEDIAARKTVQVSQALQGAVPGVTVTRSNNAPGSTANIKIRGITTISDSNPLIIVDGVPIDNINDINPNDIESMSVLKDAASASIYGSRAAAGVILITTKRAEAGTFSMTYDFNYGMEKATSMPEYVGAKRYMEMTNELRWNDNGNDNEFSVYPREVIANYDQLHLENPNVYPNTDWVGLIMNNNAPRQSHSLNIRGGSKNIQTNASFGYDKIGALYDGRDYDRVTARINNTISINDKLSAKIDLNYKMSSSNQPTVDPISLMMISAPVYAALWDDGRIASGKSGTNVYAQMKYGGFNENKYTALGGRVALDYEPIEGLKLSGIFSPNLRYDKGKYFRKQVPYYSADDPQLFEGYIEGTETTYLLESRDEGERYTGQLLANYNTSIDDHSFDFLAGFENYYTIDEYMTASRDQYQLTSFPYLDQGPLEYRNNTGGAYESAYRSFFGRVMYNYKSKYYVQANLRRDGSSRFHNDYRWGNFPSISTGWVISNESFLQDHTVISFLKLRASYGKLGNERIGNYPYQASIGFGNTLFLKGSEVVSEPSAAQSAYAIRDITWESTESYDIGVDMNFLDDKLQVTADYFYKATKDMLLALEIPDYLGYSNPDQNAGSMNSKGWEFQASWRDRIGEFQYSVSFNVSDVRSTMGDLKGTQFLGSQIIKEGSEYNEWYGYLTDGLFQSQEEVDNSATINSSVQPGDVKYIDISGPNGEPDGNISPEYDRVLLGGSLPRYSYGGTISASYKRFSLNLALQGVGKQNSRIDPVMVTPLTYNWGNIPAILDGDSWSQYNTDAENQQVRYPRLTSINGSSNRTMSDYWLFDGAYFRIKNITLKYTVPETFTSKIGLAGLSTYVSASDFWTISNYPSGWDPEVSATGYPITTQILLGLNVKF
ncbi:SusC/RagA family TonB-linked outer membrane protein [Echinicola strongylocentroti]|uniref:SusC/RagA family TonB-linked outer membrane protein n=2 Tax=Echinicola strongylocentroti TaxID=1795355 RepID=A0A2Z4IQC1_9BACT|nr:SusC/RagA family TonB-linked outer membrane protein [Echinicola strongylocentroti]